MSDSRSLLSVAEARTRLLAEFSPLPPETASLADASGRVLAGDIVASVDLPSFANSSMDGYAVRAAEVQHASPVRPVSLPVMADIRAGDAAADRLAPGAAARIMTGAPIPAGADAVVPVELTDDDRSAAGSAAPAVIQIRQAVQPGANVREAGEDLRAGSLALPAGVTIRAQQVGLLAALGHATLQVVRRPAVAVLSTGDELTGVDESPTPGKIRDVNGFILSALITRYGGRAIPVGIARDTLEAVTERLDQAVRTQADLIISSAGVSVGAFDYVKSAIASHGQLEFWRVNMRPGKPVAFGRYRGVPFLGLPGNPVSALVSFEIFARPAVLRLSGQRQLDKPTVKARLAEPVSSDGRETYLRAVVSREGEQYVARAAGGQGSAILSALARANALVVLPAGTRSIAAGASVTAWMLDWPEIVY